MDNSKEYCLMENLMVIKIILRMDHYDIISIKDEI